MRKRIVSILLALCMALSLLPANARAAELDAGMDGVIQLVPEEDLEPVPEEDLEQMPEEDAEQVPEEDLLPVFKEDFETESDSVTGTGEPLLFSTIVTVPSDHTGGTCGKNLTWSLTDDGTLTISGTGDMYDYLDGAPWSKDRSKINTIVIRTGVTSIGVSAFSGCKNLTSVTIPVSVTNIGGSVFRQCSSLTSVTIPNSVTNIGGGAFSYCSSLTSVAIPDRVTNIGDYTFNGCSGLRSVDIPDSVTSIGSCAFQHCSSLTSVTIPDRVTNIGWRTFNGCSSLISVILPYRITKIGAAAFSDCSSLTNVTIPDSVTSIDNGAFSDCSSLTGMTIPNRVTRIGNSAFSGCSSLTSVTIPDRVAAIEAYAFNRCSSLISVTIPGSVTTIGEYAFNGCNSLTNLYYGGTEEQWKAIKKGSNNNPLTNATIHHNSTGPSTPDDPNYPDTPDGTCGDHLTWTLRNGTLTIRGTGGMRDYKTQFAVPDTPWYTERDKITSVVIANGVTGIGDNAFNGCGKLASVTIPNSVKRLGSGAFLNCASLTSVTIPGGVTSIGESAFFGCGKLTSVTIPEGVASIGSYAFRNCSKLASVTIPVSVTSIGQYAFMNCSRLKDIYYAGNREQWAAIKKSGFGTGLTGTIHYGQSDDANYAQIAFQNKQSTVYIGKDSDLRATIAVFAGQESLPQDFVTWTSSDEIVATVSSNGTNKLWDTFSSSATIHGHYPGTTTITATTAYGQSISCKVRVAVSSSSFRMSGSRSLLLNSSKKFSASIDADVAFLGDSFIWTSSNSKVAAFDKKGKSKVEHTLNSVSTSDKEISDSVRVYGNATGVATITCKMPISGLRKQYQVLVYKDESAKLQKLVTGFEGAYNTYINAVEQRLSAKKNTATSSTLDDQANILIEHDKGDHKLITFLPGKDNDTTLRNNVYLAAADLLKKKTDSLKVGDISVSGVDVNQIAFDLTRAVIGGVNDRSFPYRSGNVTVTIEGIGSNGAQSRNIYYKVGSSKKELVGYLVSTQKQTMDAILDYLNELIKLEKNLVEEAWTQVKNELADMGFSGLRGMTKKKVTELLEKYLTAFEKTGVGEVAETVSTCADYYKYCNSIVSLAKRNPSSLSSTLSSMKKMTFDSETVTDRAVSAAVKELDKASDSLVSALTSYVYTGTVK